LIAAIFEGIVIAVVVVTVGTALVKSVSLLFLILLIFIARLTTKFHRLHAKPNLIHHGPLMPSKYAPLRV